MEENALTVQNAPAHLPVPRHKDYALTVRRFNEFAAGRPINEETVREFFAMEKQRGYSARTIALHKVAVKSALLAAYLLFAQIRKTYGGKVYLFEHNGKPYTRQHMGHVMSKVSRQVLGRNMHPHTMRHSRITHLLEQGEPLDAVSRFARHSQTSTTLAFYAHTQLTSADILKSSL